MNERIDVLALQATDSKGVLDRHKFAELIVSECELVVADQLTRDREANDEWDRGYISGMWAATRYMKEHFGVEC